MITDPVDSGTVSFISRRPKAADREFVSPAVEEFISSIQAQIADPELAWMFENCFPNTLDTTVHFNETGGDGGKPDTFVITGDITAMWLRDSAAQVWPYLPLAKSDPHLSRMLQGVINRHTHCILLDPYANAFLEDPNEKSEWITDHTIMKPGVHEHKWEIDSLCYPIRLAYHYWKETGDETPFDAAWEQSMDVVVRTFREQQRKDGHGPYYFVRDAPAPDLSKDEAYGLPVKPNGLIYSSFRPSDDATEYPFLVPANYFAVVSLRQLSEMLQMIRGNAHKAADAESLAKEVSDALSAHAIQTHESGTDIFAYEIDGLGNSLFIDDAGVPGLLSLPYYGACSTHDPAYVATRKFVWSTQNPWYFSGTYSGLGSPHIGPNTIWPMGKNKKLYGRSNH
jgi:meiotically up-regulated gene 157 (Mug157) protein